MDKKIELWGILTKNVILFNSKYNTCFAVKIYITDLDSLHLDEKDEKVK